MQAGGHHEVAGVHSSGGARDELAGVVLRLAADAALLVAELAAEEVRRVEPLRQLVAAGLLRERVAVHAAVLRAEGDQIVAFRPVGGAGREEWGDLSRTGDMRSDAASQGKGTTGTRTVCIAADALVPYCASQLPSPKGSGCAPRAAWLHVTTSAAQQCPREYARGVRQLAGVCPNRNPYRIPEHGGGGRGTPTAYRQ